MKKWKQLTKTILASVMAFAMVAGYGASVSATPAPALQDDGRALLNKILEVAPGLELGATTFQFSIEPKGVVKDDLADATRIDATKVSIMPELGNDGTYALGATGNLSATSVAIDGTESPDGTTGYITRKFTSGDALVAIGGNNVWPHAGVYVYEVTELPVANPAPSGEMDFSGASYQMVVYVENNTIASGGLTVTNVGFRAITDDEGTIVAAEAPEATTGLTNAKSEPNFTNRYDKLVDLTISKEVMGDFADTTKGFSYTMSLTRPAGHTGTDSYKGIIVDANGDPVKDSTNTVQTVSITFAGATANATFVLSHGQSVQFEHKDPAPTGDFAGQTGLPSGTKWVVTEAAAPGYKVAVSGESNGTTFSILQTTNPNTAVTIPATGNLVLGEGDNFADWVNTRVDVTPTGILLNNLPYILLIVVALGGFAGYIVSKRRKAVR